MILLTLSSCATAPVFSDAVVKYPGLADQSCSLPASPSTVSVSVRDLRGVFLPGALVLLGELGSPKAVQAVETDAYGKVVLTVSVGARYMVAVALDGFVPITRMLEVSAGCSGSLSVTLSVASTELLVRQSEGQ
jgi:hypothetical protein